MRPADESDLALLLQSLWKGRLVAVFTTCIFAVGGATYGLLTKNRFRAEVVMVQADNAKTQSGSLAQLAGAASIFGVNIGSSGAGQEAVVVLKSRELARNFIVDNQLLAVLLKDKERFDPAVGASMVNASDRPDIRDAVEYFQKKVLAVDDDKKAQVINVTVTWTDGEVAASWANELVKMANARMRADAVTEAQRNIDYLKGEMASTNVISLQQAVGRLLETEMQKLMIARGNEEYAFKIVDHAVAPKKKYWPPRVALVIASAFIGFVVSVAGLFILAEFRANGPVIPGDVANS